MPDIEDFPPMKDALERLIHYRAGREKYLSDGTQAPGQFKSILTEPMLAITSASPEERAAQERSEAVEKAKELPPLGKECQYLRILAADMKVDLASALTEAGDEGGMGASPYGRMMRALEEANALLEGDVDIRLMDYARWSLDYVRRGLDEHWVRHRQEAAQHSYQETEATREAQRDAETRAYRDIALPKSGGWNRIPSGYKEIQEDVERARHQELPDEGSY
ncbi:hypothetical protein AB0P17_42825 [Streptomyces sp. NPDC088124]|uniref:hypothetical protein n=1 Tax=Streptomyces sp. NPDC088124 TaxID=3154654 RepID=UPI00342E51E4